MSKLKEGAQWLGKKIQPVVKAAMPHIKKAARWGVDRLADVAGEAAVLRGVPRETMKAAKSETASAIKRMIGEGSRSRRLNGQTQAYKGPARYIDDQDLRGGTISEGIAALLKSSVRPKRISNPLAGITGSRAKAKFIEKVGIPVTRTVLRKLARF